jgi:hypothetical protein
MMILRLVTFGITKRLEDTFTDQSKASLLILTGFLV